MASDAEGTGGFRYNDIATSADVAAGEYFTYKGVKYAGTYYKGNYTPTITDNLYKVFQGSARTRLEISRQQDGFWAVRSALRRMRVRLSVLPFP